MIAVVKENSNNVWGLYARDEETKEDTILLDGMGGSDILSCIYILQTFNVKVTEEPYLSRKN